MAEDEGFDLINVVRRQAVARNSPPDCCILNRSNPYTRAKRKTTPKGVVFFLAEDEGFEPPRTESESGVLPLH